MASIIDVCNLALSRVGAAKIQSLDDKSKSANECSTILPFARDAVLRFHDWAFARKRVDLGLLDTGYYGFNYVYQYPTDCLCVRKLIGTNGETSSYYYDFKSNSYKNSGKIKYELASAPDLNSTYILTNQELATLVYTARVTNFNIYDSMFVEALAWKIASDLAMPLASKPEMQQQFYSMFYSAIKQAQVINANEEEIEVDESSSLLKSRL